MQKLANTAFLVLVATGAFLVGSLRSQRSGGSALEHRILYYQDPMHPAFRSDKPGIAPDCGMQLRPVYADGASPTPGQSEAAPRPGRAVHVSPDRQQLIGVKIEEAEEISGPQKLRTLGRVAADETRVHRLNTSSEGWIREIYPVTVGSLVQKNEPLASFYTPAFQAAEHSYLYSLSALERLQSGGREAIDQMAQAKANLELARDNLQYLGMSELQIEEIGRTRQVEHKIVLRAPATGFVLVRNVSLGQRFEKGAELFRLADLSHVWIVADLFENESRYSRLNASAVVRYQGQAFPAKRSDILPQFDPSSRTLKLRLEAANPGYALRPDMFVDIELAIQLPRTVAVPVDAVLDSGLRKTVFVDGGSGYFEPRQVETGWRMGTRIEITKGLRAGERIVSSATFLLDSETKMRNPTFQAAHQDD